jgi:hypothetical protein
MKRLLRKIEVNNEQYYWCVFHPNCDGDGGSKFQIWKNKAKILEEVIHVESITPRTVRERILEIEQKVETKKQ